MKILLLTDIPPCKDYAGGLFLDQLCRLLPEGSIACFAVVNPALNAQLSPDLKWIPIEYYEKPNEMALRLLPYQLGGISAFAKESYHSLVKNGTIIKEAIEFGRRFGADTLWCLLEGQTMIQIVLPVMKGLGVPLRTQVMDPPYFWLREHRVDQVSAARILRKFHQALRGSTTCAAASWAMAEQYQLDYGTQSVPLVPSFNLASALPPSLKLHLNDEFVIGLAGQTYAIKEWQALIGALNSVDWRIGGRNVRIRLLGRDTQLHADSRMRVEFCGWNSQAETIRLLSEADLLYCPYWFDSQFEIDARLCFPSKLTTYFAAGRPVLFHGPEYASPARFLRDNDAGSLCHSVEHAEIVKALNHIVLDAGYYAQLARNGRAALESHLSLASLRTSFAQFLQVEENSLRAA
jgi:glycosyltransferase involved in cell wall biosynthesis